MSKEDVLTEIVQGARGSYVEYDVTIKFVTGSIQTRSDLGW